MFIGYDLANDNDLTALVICREGFVCVCTLPEGLGNVTSFENRGGKLIAHTESGIPMVVPVPKD